MSWLFNEIKGWLAVVGGALILAAAAYVRGRKEGVQKIEAEQRNARDALEAHYDEIDRQNIDPAGSYDRLRGMSGGKGGR